MSKLQDRGRHRRSQGRLLSGTLPGFLFAFFSFMEDIGFMKLSLSNNESIEKFNKAIEDSVERIQRTASDLEERLRSDATLIADRARETWHRSRDLSTDATQAVARNAKEHPIPYILAGIGVAALLTGIILTNSVSRKNKS